MKAIVIRPIILPLILIVVSIIIIMLGIILSISIILIFIGLPLIIIGLLMLLTGIFAFLRMLLSGLFHGIGNSFRKKEKPSKKKIIKGKIVDVDEKEGVYSTGKD
ncbi:hypothetical protein J4401_01370 [Candidatus Woesearchaeota archaeon]|nr:hypothetical protein [Candidatus Woesearchaeota archaeon]